VDCRLPFIEQAHSLLNYHAHRVFDIALIAHAMHISVPLKYTNK